MNLDALLLASVVAVPFAGVGLLARARRAPRLRAAASVALPLATALLATAAVPLGFGDAAARHELAPGLMLELRLDAIGALFALLAAWLWVATSVYSLGYLRGHGHARARYDAAFAAVVGASLGVALAGNLLTLVLFYELITLAAYPLVIHEETPAALAAGRKYLAYTLAGGAALVVALGAGLAGGARMAFVPGGDPTLAAAPAGLARAVALLLVAGFAVKATLMPLHGWLPSAMVAPTPVSGLLHAVAVVTAGVFGLLRAFGWLLGPDLARESGAQAVTLTLASFTMLAASLLALLQSNLKLRLAYSTVAQLAMVAAGAALLAPEALAAGALHLATHGTAKLALFLVAGALLLAGRPDVRDLDGAGRAMPLVGAALVLAILSLVGLPGGGAFLSKEALLHAAWTSGAAPVAAALVAASVLTVLYLLPLAHRAYRRPREPLQDARASLGVPALLVALAAVGLGLWPALAWALPATAAGADAPDARSFSAVATSLAIVGAGVALYAARGTTAARRALGLAARLPRAFSAVGGATVGAVRALAATAARAQTSDVNRTAAGLLAALVALALLIAWGVTV